MNTNHPADSRADFSMSKMSPSEIVKGSNQPPLQGNESSLVTSFWRVSWL